MYSVLCFKLLLVLAATGQKYNLEQRSNKLFGRTLRQVLEQFRGTSQYLDILTQRFSNWKKSADVILIALDEDQTNKFLKDVENLDDSDTIENMRRNLKNKRRFKTSMELLDRHSYAKLPPDGEAKLSYLAHIHVNEFLRSYMEALLPGSSSTDNTRRAPMSNDEHTYDAEILENIKRTVAEEQVPQESAVSAEQVPQESQKRNQGVLKTEDIPTYFISEETRPKV